MEAAARAITYGALVHSGQVCMSTERVVVQRNAANRLLLALQGHFKRVRAGNVLADPDAKISSLLNEAAAENVLNMLREAQEAGASVILGDSKKEWFCGADTYCHRCASKPGMRIFDRESFGPVVAVSTVDTIDEAIRWANTTEYSLTASLWTRDVNRALEVGARIRAGMISVNGSTYHGEAGLGHAEQGGATGYGRFDVDNFTSERAIVIHPEQARYPLVDDP